MSTQNNLESKYRQQMRQLFAEAEKFRQLRCSKIRIFVFAAKIIGVLFLVYLTVLILFSPILNIFGSDKTAAQLAFSSLFLGSSLFVIPIAAIATIICYSTRNAFIRDYANRSKELIIPLLLKRYLGQIKYQPKCTIDETRLNLFKSGLKKYNTILSEDLIAGHYNKMPVQLCMLKLSDKREESETIIFSGMFLTIDIDKSFNGDTYIDSKRERIDGFLKNDIGASAFDTIYNVHTDDWVQARNLFTAPVMAELIKLAKLFPKGTPRFVIKKKQILIGLPTGKNDFETIQDYQNPLSEEEFEKMFRQLHQALITAETLTNTLKVEA